MQQTQFLNHIRRNVSKVESESEIILFGSRARGDVHLDSDWDILILSNQNELSFEKENEFINSLYEIELETGEVITPLIYTRQQWYSTYTISPLFKNIEKEGVRLK